MKGIVYILEDVSGKRYIGSSDNLNRRLAHHKYGGTATTKRMGEFRVVLAQEFPTLLEARKIELRLKKFKRRDFIDKIIRDGVIKLRA
jgi:predicted GIY-YIG superfamily endonuclease